MGREDAPVIVDDGLCPAEEVETGDVGGVLDQDGQAVCAGAMRAVTALAS